jgi:hypothetical protein
LSGLSPEEAKERREAYEREYAKKNPTWGKRRRKYDPEVLSDPINRSMFDWWEQRYNVPEVDVQGAHDDYVRAWAGASGKTWQGERVKEDFPSLSDLQEVERDAKKKLAAIRRDMAYMTLSEVRPMGTTGIVVDSQESIVATNAVAQASVWLPSDWVKDSNQSPHKLTVAWESDRGHYQHNFSGNVDTGESKSRLVVSPSAEAEGIEKHVGTALHELVHRAERVRDGIQAAEWAFYTARVSPGTGKAWEGLQPLAEMTKNSSYKPDEKARGDKFTDYYSGKTYGDEMDSSYEILSMGIEDLATGYHGIIEEDEEYRQFVLGALAYL